jgi:VanZ family protein
MRHFWPPILWAFLILFLTLVSGKDVPEAPFFNFDKIVHILLFSFFSLSLMTALRKQRFNKMLFFYAPYIAIVFTFLFGVMTEVLQEYFIPDRYGDWKDAISDLIGSILGYLWFSLIYRGINFSKI